MSYWILPMIWVKDFYEHFPPIRILPIRFHMLGSTSGPGSLKVCIHYTYISRLILNQQYITIFFYMCCSHLFCIFCVKCVCVLAVLTTGETQDTCTAGVGTLLLEFGILSHYTGMHGCMYVCIRVHTFIHLQIYL